jgi:hypothetical protein
LVSFPQLTGLAIGFPGKAIHDTMACPHGEPMFCDSNGACNGWLKSVEMGVDKETLTYNVENSKTTSLYIGERNQKNLFNRGFAALVTLKRGCDIHKNGRH